MNDTEYAEGLYRGSARETVNPLVKNPRTGEPVIQYARTADAVNIAYYSIGSGAPLVYLVPFGHLVHEWHHQELVPGASPWATTDGSSASTAVALDSRTEAVSSLSILSSKT